MKKLFALFAIILLISSCSATYVSAADEPSITVTHYTIVGNKITGIERGTGISAFLGNITFTGGATGAVYQSDGTTRKESGVIEANDILMVSPTNTQYVLKLVSFIQEETFDSSIASNVNIHAAGFAKIARPANGDTLSLTAVPDDAGVNRAVVSNMLQNAAVKMTYSTPLTGKIVYEMDYWLDGPATMATLRFIDIYGTNSVTGASSQLFCLSNGANNTDNTYSLRPLYYDSATGANQTVSISGSYQYKRWYRAKVIVDTDADTATLYIDDSLILSQGLKFYNNVNATNITSVSAVQNGAASGVRFAVDRFEANYILPPSSNTGITSDLYTVETDKVTGILEGATADVVMENITPAYGATMQVYAIYNGASASGNVIRSGAVKDGDKLVVTAENQTTVAVYSIDVKQTIEIHFFNSSSEEVQSLSEITDKKLSVKADIFNQGQFEGNSDFVLIVCAFKDNEMVSAVYEPKVLPISERIQTIDISNFEIPDNSSIRAFVWNSVYEILPFGTPVDIQ